MTNEEYIQWQPLIKKVAFKYRNNIFKIELEDLEQIASIGLFKGFKSYNKSYNNSKGASLKTWLYNSAERAIFREFNHMKRIKRQSNYGHISLNTPTSDDDTYLEDIIQDNNINIENEIEDKLLLDSYKEEINLCLFGLEREIVYKILFEDKTYKELAIIYDLSIEEVKRMKSQGFRRLKNKSKMIRERWMDLKELDMEKSIISAYNNPENMYYKINTTDYLRKKYKNELDILDFIQSIFDDALDSLYPSDKIKRFYLEKLNEVISSDDIYLLNEIVFNKRSIVSLMDEGYSLEDVSYIKNRIKRNIIANKELAYKQWLDFNKNYKEASNLSKETVKKDNIIFNSNQVTLDMILGL